MMAITRRDQNMSESLTAGIEDADPDDQVADRIRIRPSDFSVPWDDPFRNDLLDRKSAIEGLTRIVGASESPYVISVDAAWGSGKTAFLDMWCQHFENEGFTVVQFNAWETDFATSPFQALSAEITQRLERFSNSTVEQGMNILKSKVRAAAIAISKSALRGTGELIPGGTIVAKTAIGAVESWSEDPISDYQQTRATLREFTESIGDVAETVSRLNGGKPLVVAIDELDRCRPTYAIELIETVKHIFSVENVVFILAINSTALTHSAKSLYGAEFDAERYFRRFFDLQFRLPVPDRRSFAETLLKATKLQERIESQHGDTSMSITLAKSLLRSDSLSLRDSEQAAHRLGLILGMIHDAKPWMEFFALIGLSIMALKPDEYAKFLRGEMTDEQAFEILASNLSFEDVDSRQIKPEIEAAVIALAQCRSIRRPTNLKALTSPLIVKHRQITDSIDSDNRRQTNEEMESTEVLDMFGRFWNILHNRGVGSTLIESLRCLELLLPQDSHDSDSTPNQSANAPNRLAQ